MERNIGLMVSNCLSRSQIPRKGLILISEQDESASAKVVCCILHQSKGPFPVKISFTPLSRPVTKEDITSFVKSVSRLIYEIFTFEVKCYSIT